MQTSSMLLLPISIDESKNLRFTYKPECVEILDVYPDYYQKIGYNEPWIGYFVSLNGQELVGAGGFKGAPKDGKVEIAYSTFKKYEGQGIGTEICRQLTVLSRQTDPLVRVTARTLQDGEASIKILKKNGFECLGVVYDEDDGDVLEWEFKELP